MKVGIVTFHRAHNCGAALQCAALVMVLQRMGHTVKVIDCNNVGESHWPNFRGVRTIRGLVGFLVRLAMSIGIADRFFRHYRLFRRRLIPMTQNCIGKKFPDEFDRIIVGSDQVFNPVITGSQTNAFLLKDFPNNSKKSSYAASFGAATLPEQYRGDFAAELAKFKHLGFRESSAEKICREELGINVKTQTVLDPTLLLDAYDYKEFESPSYVGGEYVVIYWGGRCGEEARAIAHKLAVKHGLKVVFINQWPLSRFRQRKGDWIGMPPDRFLWLMRNARFVISTSFHGTAFALINRKPFIVIRPVGYDLVRQAKLDTTSEMKGVHSD